MVGGGDNVRRRRHWSRATTFVGGGNISRGRRHWSGAATLVVRAIIVGGGINGWEATMVRAAITVGAARMVIYVEEA